MFGKTKTPATPAAVKTPSASMTEQEACDLYNRVVRASGAATMKQDEAGYWTVTDNSTGIILYSLASWNIALIARQEARAAVNGALNSLAESLAD